MAATRRPSYVARQLTVDRSTVSRAVRRVRNDSGLIAAAGTILGQLISERNQH